MRNYIYSYSDTECVEESVYPEVESAETPSESTEEAVAVSAMGPEVAAPAEEYYDSAAEAAKYCPVTAEAEEEDLGGPDEDWDDDDWNEK